MKRPLEESKRRIQLNFLPKLIRHFLIRRFAFIPDICHSSNFTVKLASTELELEQAFSLLHDCYVGQGLMVPHPSGLRCNVFSLLPENATIIVKYKDEVVGTVALIKDNALGLPSDQSYHDENQKLRRENKRLIEVSALAVKKNFRENHHGVLLLLMKFLYNYSQRMDADCLVCTVHPRAQDFYEAIWHFRREGNILQYSSVNNALAIHMHMLTDSRSIRKLVDSYRFNFKKRNLAGWVLQEDSRFYYPDHLPGQILAPVMTPELMEHFFVRRTDVLSQLTHEQKLIFSEIYRFHFGRSYLENFEQMGISNRELRLPVSIPVSLALADTEVPSWGNLFSVNRVLNLSPAGAFISLNANGQMKPGARVHVAFKIGKKVVSVWAHVSWVNEIPTSHLPRGFGVKFDKVQKEITPELHDIVAVTLEPESEM